MTHQLPELLEQSQREVFTILIGHTVDVLCSKVADKRLTKCHCQGDPHFRRQRRIGTLISDLGRVRGEERLVGAYHLHIRWIRHRN